MNSGELVRRLARLAAGGGSGEDGAALAAEYAERMRELARRMDAVETAQAKGEYGEAMRLMEERPRLLDEIGALDFHQFAPWKAMCEERGWDVPAGVDGAAVERLLDGYNNSAAMDAVLKEYRKAVRRHDAGGQVRALRRLTAGPGGGEWTDSLAWAEKEWAGELARAFEAAKAADDRAAARAAAEELAGGGWRTPPDAKTADAARAWLDARDAEDRQKALDECLARLKKFSGDAWDGARAGADVRKAQYLTGAGADPGAEGAALIAEASARCSREAKEAAAAESRVRFEGALKEAVRRGAADEAAELLASPEALDPAADAELVGEGREMVAKAEAARRRRTGLRLAALAALVAAALAATVFVHHGKQLAKRVEEVREELRAAAEGPKPWASLSRALESLERDDPEVYAAEGVREFRDALRQILDERGERRARAGAVLERLADMDAGGWEEETADGTEALFGALRAELDDDMPEETQRAAALESRWRRAREARRQAGLVDARAAMAALEEREAALADRLGKTYLTEDLDAEADRWLADAGAWRERHGWALPDEAAALSALAGNLGAAQAASRGARSALERLQSAPGAAETADARAELRRDFRGYPGVEAMGDAPVTRALAEAVLDGTLPGQANVRKLRRTMAQGEEWAKFLAMEVRIVEEVKELTQLYGINRGDQFEAVAVGRAQLAAPGTVMVAKGDLFSFESGEMVREVDYTTAVWSKKHQILLPPCEELAGVADESRSPRLTPKGFAEALYGRIAGHLEAAHGDAVPPFGDYSYHDLESGKSGPQPLKEGRYPAYRRVQTLALYFDWLEKLGELPVEGEAPRETIEECRRLAEPIALSKGVNPALSWTHLMNPRVAQRNKECADFLAEVPANFPEACRKALADRAKLRKISDWKIESAGKMAFRPEAPGEGGWDLLPGVAADHPLYAIRLEGGRPVLRAVLWPRGDGEWEPAGEKGLPGEPLFQVRIDGKCEHAEEKLAQVLGGVSEDARRLFAKCGYPLETVP